MRARVSERHPESLSGHRWPTLPSGANSCLLVLRTIVWVALDVVAIGGLIFAIAIAAGFSGLFRAGPWLVSATSSRNPITIAAVALLFRSMAPAVPFLGVIPATHVPPRVLAAWRRFHDVIATLTVSHALLIVGSVTVASLALKLAIAYQHPGFWTGDDVEIHEMTFARLFHSELRPWC